jgi:hypothetical protein
MRKTIAKNFYTVMAYAFLSAVLLLNTSEVLSAIIAVGSYLSIYFERYIHLQVNSRITVDIRDQESLALQVNNLTNTVQTMTNLSTLSRR